MLVEENENIVSVHMDSILDLIEGNFSDKFSRRKIEKFISNRSCDLSHYGKTNRTYRDVINHALVGDSVLLSDLNSKIEILNKVTGKNTMQYEQKIQKSRRVRRFADQGDELDIEKVYNGEMDTCWSKTERVEFDIEHKFVTLFIENGANWDENVYSSFWRSAIAVFITRELERAGKSVRIIVGSAVSRAIRNSRKYLVQSITVKEYNQRVSLERIAAMTHLGFFRSVSFALFHMSDYQISEGIGHHAPMDSSTIPLQLQRDIDKGNTKLIHIKAVGSQTGAIEALKSAYKQLLSAATE